MAENTRPLLDQRPSHSPGPRMSRDRMNLFGFVPGYGTHIYDSGREPGFLVLLAFILTLAGTRFYTRMARVRGWGSAIVGDVHVHHLVPGVVLSLVAGGLALALEPREFWVEGEAPARSE